MAERDKVRTIKSLKRSVGRLRRQGKKIVFTNGCFDILHRGHVQLLREARSLGDVLIVAINSDASVRKIKGPSRPFNTAKDRAIVLSSLEDVDYVTIFSAADPGHTITALSPDVLVKGGDWKPAAIVGADHVKSRGGSVHSLPLVRGHSTSRLIKAASKCK